MALVTGAVLWPNGKIYFFSGSNYFRYDIAKETMDDGFPLPISGNWPGLADAQIQGAAAWPNGKAYLFSRDRCFQYDIAKDQADPGSPFPTTTIWPGILEGPNRDREVSAAVNWPNGKSYFFQNDRYYRFDTATQRIDPDYPQLTKDAWPGLWTTGQNFTAAFVWPKLIDGRTKAYFFHQTLYHRYDIAADRADPGYPLPITGNWAGL